MRFVLKPIHDKLDLYMKLSELNFSAFSNDEIQPIAIGENAHQEEVTIIYHISFLCSQRLLAFAIHAYSELLLIVLSL